MNSHDRPLQRGLVMARSVELRGRAALVAWGRAAVVAVFVLAGLNWVGWQIGAEEWTRGLPFWPQMPPWSAALLALVGVAILLHSGRPSSTRVMIGVGAALVAGVLSVVFLAEHITNMSFGLAQVLFPDAASALPATFPEGRPSVWALSSILLLSIGVALTRLDRPWGRVTWSLCLTAAVVMPTVTALANVFGVISLKEGQANSVALAVTLLVAGAFLTYPDRPPVAWLLARADRWPLIRMAGILAGLPLVVGLSRLVLTQFGLPKDVVWVLSIGVGTGVVGVCALYVGQREQKSLIEAEKRFRILADNAVDVVMHMHGREATWISPSVESALGTPPEWWIGEDVTRRVHPDDVHVVETALQQLDHGEPARVRCRIEAADGVYHWTEGHAKAYVDGEGNNDGAIASWRVIDEQVAAERRMERLAKFDVLTGLVNRAEAVARFEAALRNPRSPGSHLGVLFCDIDHFKDINDTYGHAVGDLVLTTLAARVRQCLRDGDTVGRTGGDEMLVLLPGIHNMDEVAWIATKVHCQAGEPIHQGKMSIKATLSIGATLAVAGESVAEITARADAAMYKAKQAGRNTTVTL